MYTYKRIIQRCAARITVITIVSGGTRLRRTHRARGPGRAENACQKRTSPSRAPPRFPPHGQRRRKRTDRCDRSFPVPEVRSSWRTTSTRPTSSGAERLFFGGGTTPPRRFPPCPPDPTGRIPPPIQIKTVDFLCRHVRRSEKTCRSTRIEMSADSGFTGVERSTATNSVLEYFWILDYDL